MFLQWWLDHPEAESDTKSLPTADCSPLGGTSSLLVVTAKSTISTWPSHRSAESDMSTDSGPTSEEDNYSFLDTDESRKEHCPWDDWNAFVQELDSSNANCVVCSPSASANSGMPLYEGRSSLHREKIGLPPCLDNRRVARPVGKAEIDRTPAAKASMQKEWDRLRSNMV